jgi:hypothetical protein
VSDLTWMLKIVDGVSTPAGHAARALKAVEQELKAVEQALKAVDTASSKKMAGAADAQIKTMQTFGKAMATSVENMGAKGPGAFGKMVQWVGKNFGQGAAEQVMGVAEGMSKADDALQSVGMSLGGLVAGGAVAAAAAIAAVGIAVVAVTAKLADMAFNAAKAFASMVIDRGRFREDTLAQLKAMLKSDTEAQKVFEIANKFAKETQFSSDAVISGFKDLLAGGFKADELEGWMRSIGDAAAVVGQDRIPDLVRALSKLRATGKLSEGILAPLKLDRKLLAKNAGLDDVSKLAGLDGTKAEAAIKKTIEDMYGGALQGESGNLTKMLSNLGDAWNDLIDQAFAASKDKESGITAYFDTVKGGVKDVLDALSGKTGSAAVSMINRLGDALNIVATLLRGFIVGLLEGLGKGIGDGATEVERLSKADLEKLANDAKQVGDAIGKIASATAELANVLPTMQTLEKLWTATKLVAIGLSPVVVLTGYSMLLAFSPLLVLLGLIGIAIVAVGAVIYYVGKAFIEVGGWIWEALDPVVAYLRGVFGPAFQEVFASISESARSIWASISPVFGPIFDTIVSALQPVIGWLESNWKTVAAIIGFPFLLIGAIVIGAVAVVLGALLGILWVVAKVAEGVAWLASVIASAFSLAAWDAIWERPKAALETLRTMISSFSLADAGASIGRSLIDGLVAGITGGVSAAAGAASGAASAVIAAASGPKGFDAHSPSKKLEELGGFASEGLAKGITRKAPLATSAVADMVSPPSPGSTTAQWAQAGQSGGGARSVTISEGAIVINAPTGDGDDIRRALVSAFETISIQLNGAPA